MARALGHEIVEFFASEWPEHYYVDDSELWVEGGRIVASPGMKGASLPLNSKYELNQFGVLCFEEGVPNITLNGFFARWRKKKLEQTIAITFDKTKQSEVMEFLSGIGVRVAV